GGDKVDRDVNVHRPAGVPAWVDGPERGDALRVGLLDAAQKRLADGVLRLDSGVHTSRVAVPDVDRGALDRLAPRDVDDRQLQRQRDAGPPLGDDAANLVAGEIVRSRRLLGSQHAGDGTRGDGDRARALRRRVLARAALPDAGAQGGRGKAAELDERAAAGDSIVLSVRVFVHAAKVARPDKSRLRAIEVFAKTP